MTPERWERIETLYHAAREVAPNERMSFLAAACADDAELRARIESMLAQDSSGKLLDRPAADLLKTEALDPGTELGPYRIVGFLGAGGMGRVYRAHDMRLQRDVAIKIASERFGERFEREARAIAALNHPNVCTVHDVGPDFLVMELVEGESPRGPLPLDEALAMARQIAAALDAAHAKGIVHRDLKPANIKLKRDGTVKVLDFGLAKLHRAEAGEETDSISQVGMLVGTAAYMSPEQIRGSAVDERTDIWSLGVLLYEMLTGRRPFEGKTTQDTLALVLTKEPDWQTVPAAARPLLRQCLEKEPERRLPDLGDALRRLSSMHSHLKWLPQWRWLAGAATIAVLGGVWAEWGRDLLKPPEPVRMEFASTPAAQFIDGSFPQVSPDGRWAAFPARGPDGVVRQYLRKIGSPDDSQVATPLVGSESTNHLPPPVFWSPDSRSAAVSVTPAFRPGRLVRIDIASGAARTIANIAGPAAGGTWNFDGVILYGSNDGGGG